MADPCPTSGPGGHIAAPISSPPPLFVVACSPRINECTTFFPVSAGYVVHSHSEGNTAIGSEQRAVIGARDNAFILLLILYF